MWLQHPLVIRAVILLVILIVYGLLRRGRLIGFIGEMEHQYGRGKAWLIIIGVIVLLLLVSFLLGSVYSPLNQWWGPAPGSVRP